MLSNTRVDTQTFVSFINDCKYVTQDQAGRYFGLSSRGGVSERLNLLVKKGYLVKSRFGGVIVYFLSYSGYRKFIDATGEGYYKSGGQTMATVEHTFMETDYRIFARRYAGMEWVYGSRDILKKQIKYGERRPDGLVDFVDYAYALEFELSHKSAKRVWEIRSKYNIELERQMLIKEDSDKIEKRLKGVIVVGPNEYVLSKYMDPVFNRIFAVCLMSNLRNCIYYDQSVKEVKCRDCGTIIKINKDSCSKCGRMRPAAKGGVEVMELRGKLIQLREYNSL